VGRPKNKRQFYRRPYKQLACDIVRHALVDARQGDAEAVAWLQSSEWCFYLLDALNIPAERVVHLLADQEATAQPALPGL